MNLDLLVGFYLLACFVGLLCWRSFGVYCLRLFYGLVIVGLRFCVLSIAFAEFGFVV